MFIYFLNNNILIRILKLKFLKFRNKSEEKIYQIRKFYIGNKYIHVFRKKSIKIFK